MNVNENAWAKYGQLLYKASKRAGDEFRDAIWNVNGYFGGVGLGNIPRDELLRYAYVIASKYGEATAALAAAMYDDIAVASGVVVESAVPAATATFGEVAKAVNGTAKIGNPEIVGGAIERLVKMAGDDTVLQNASRDGAQVAYIVHGDTCAYCIVLAGDGWHSTSADDFIDGHAAHLHANCDCTYGVRFNDSLKYAFYKPEKYARMYYDAPLRDGETPTSKNRINAMRRAAYAKNKDEINRQKRAAYQIRKELNESKAEEINVGGGG